MSHPLNKVRFIFRRFKFFSIRDFKESAIEVIITCFSAYFPLWISIVLLISTTHSFGKYWELFLGSGELLIVSCAIIGPLFYILFKKYGKDREDENGIQLTQKFPYGIVFNIIAVFIWVASGIIFFIKKFGDFGDKSFQNFFEEHGIKAISIFFTIVSVLILFIVTAIRNALENPPDAVRAMSEEQSDFERKFNESR